MEKKVIEHRDAIFDEVATHDLLGSFPLLLTDYSPRDDSQHVSIDLSPSHSNVGPLNPMIVPSCMLPMLTR